MIATKSFRYHGRPLAMASLLLTVSGHFIEIFDQRDPQSEDDIDRSMPDARMGSMPDVREATVINCSFDLKTGDKTYPRHFEVRFKKDAKYLIFDSHGYLTPDYGYQHRFSKFVDYMDYLDATIITTWGSADSFSNLAGWNAWGWGEKAPPTQIGGPLDAYHNLKDWNAEGWDRPGKDLAECGDPEFLKNNPKISKDTTCTTKHDTYECYDTQRKDKGCNSTEPQASSVTCATMSGQDDLQYMRTVISYVKQRWGNNNTKVVVTGQSMGGIISAHAAQELMGLVDFSIPVSAGGARNRVHPFSPKNQVKILHFHGIFDAVIPICFPPADVVKIFGRQLGDQYKTYELPVVDGNETKNVSFYPLPRGCNDIYNNPVCGSMDQYFYSGLRTTTQMYNKGVKVDNLTELLSQASFFKPTNLTTSEEKEATLVKCARINNNTAVCLFNGCHCLPFQRLNTSSSECEWQDGNRGTQAFMEVVKEWLDTDGCFVPR